MKLAAGFALTGVVALMSFPMVFAGGDAPPPCGSIADGGMSARAPVDDGSPTILGPPTLTVAHLTAWWTAQGKGQPPRLRMPINDVIADYVNEGAAEGVRGDLAFAQAVLETGWFTNSDTSINNFAGVGHYDGTASGFGYSTPTTGIRAQIQLLKKFANGNDTPLTSPDVSPNAGARASTWAQLASRWATAGDYWSKISTLYRSMSDGALRGPGSESAGTCVMGIALVRAAPLGTGSYALPVEAHWYAEHPEWFTKPHHDYPAADIPVPTGTPVFAAAPGTVASAPAGKACGLGVIITGDDGATYLYCHGSDGGQLIGPGEHVDAGQLIMHSASTGNSTGPHLHFGIRIGGQNRCPQPFLVALATGSPVSPAALPTTGCSY